MDANTTETGPLFVQTSEVLGRIVVLVNVFSKILPLANTPTTDVIILPMLYWTPYIGVALSYDILGIIQVCFEEWWTQLHICLN